MEREKIINLPWMYMALIGVGLIFLFMPACGANTPEEFFDQGKKCLENEDYQCSIQNYQRGLENDPENSSALNNIGIAYLRTGECVVAEEYFQIAEKDPNIYQRVRLNRALSYSCQNKDDDAKEILTDILYDDPDNIQALFLLSSILFEQGDYKGAETYLAELYRLNPSNYEVIRMYGVVKIALGEYEKGLELINLAIDYNHQDELSYYNRGVAFEKMGRFKEAVDSYNRTIELNPDNEKAWYNLAIIQWNHYLLNESMHSLDVVTSLEPNMSEAWFFKGLIYKEQLNITGTKESFKKAAELAPDNHFRQAYLKKYDAIPDTYELGVVRTPLEPFWKSVQIILPIGLFILCWILFIIGRIFIKNSQ